MKKKKFLSVFVVMLMIFSPLFFSCMKVHADDANESAESKSSCTVVLKSGKGSGNDIKFTGKEITALPEGQSPKAGKFYMSNQKIYFVAPNKPDSYSSPEDQSNTFMGWTDGGNLYYPYDSIQVPENGTLTLTAKWDDSWFKLQTPDGIKITGPGYTKFTCTLTDLHLGSSTGKDQMRRTAESLKIRFYKGTLEYNGKKLPYLVSANGKEAEDFADSVKLTKDDKGKTFDMFIYISPEDFNKAQAGTYKGNIKYTGIFGCKYRELRDGIDSSPDTIKGRSFYIPITLGKGESVAFPPTDDKTNATLLILTVATGLLGFATAIIPGNKQKHRKTNQ